MQTREDLGGASDQSHCDPGCHATSETFPNQDSLKPYLEFKTSHSQDGHHPVSPSLAPTLALDEDSCFSEDMAVIWVWWSEVCAVCSPDHLSVNRLSLTDPMNLWRSDPEDPLFRSPAGMGTYDLYLTPPWAGAGGQNDTSEQVGYHVS